MLSALSIRNLLLIESADLAFDAGLSVVTGETGAGKSVLLGSLVLVLGGRADRALVRPGAQGASVSASFEVPAGHPARALAAEAGLEIDTGEPLLLRRTLSAAGQSRAFLNDCAITVQLLRAIGDCLAEIHGQHDERGLLDAASHRALVDSYAGHEALIAKVAQAYAAWRAAEEALQSFASMRAKAQAEREFLEQAVRELNELAPQTDEAEALMAERALRLASGRIAGDVEAAYEALSEGGGLDARLGAVLRRLEKADPAAERLLAPALGALERTLIEAREAEALLLAAREALAHDPARLERLEERLHALRAAARKYNVAPESLPAQLAAFADALNALEAGEEGTAKLEAARAQAEKGYLEAAAALSHARIRAAGTLDAAVNRELKPLKLAEAEFVTSAEQIPLTEAGPLGLDRLEFRIRTNKGTPPGPLQAIASGGELARFILALKVVLARQGRAGLLIFDEVDRGVGGAVADAVGERLARLAAEAQVLVVTHSPQVAARGAHHYLVEKLQGKAATASKVRPLAQDERLEEVARMLAGARITDEARAAAAKLVEAAQAPLTDEAQPRRKRAARA